MAFFEGSGGREGKVPENAGRQQVKQEAQHEGK